MLNIYVAHVCAWLIEKKKDILLSLAWVPCGDGTVHRSFHVCLPDVITNLIFTKLGTLITGFPL